MRKMKIILSLGVIFALLLLTNAAVAKEVSTDYAKYSLIANTDAPGKCAVQFASQNTALLTYFNIRNRLVLNQRIALFSNTYGLDISAETIAKNTDSQTDKKRFSGFADNRTAPVAINYS